ncbi:MAG: AAA domain-containing protein [Saprospiraceae bacterium]|nr:AAA domain-containing protein [Saprospiraceae bacterium]
MNTPSTTFDRINELIDHTGNLYTKTIELFASLEEMVMSWTDQNDSLFANFKQRLQQLYYQHNISEDLYDQILDFKKNIESVGESDSASLFNENFLTGLSILIQLTALKHKESIPFQLQSWILPSKNLHKKSDTTFYKTIKASIIEIDEFVHFILDEKDASIHVLKFNSLSLTQQSQLSKAALIIKFPFYVCFHQIEKKEDGWKAEDLVIFPDYLIDVTSIASCYQLKQSQPIKHFINLFSFSPAGKSILLGTAVNDFLDELIVNEEVQYDELITRVFYKNPFAFSLLNQTDMNDFFTETKKHFIHLKEMVHDHFDQKIKHLNQCLLEPSFYSTIYGIQGRLDVLHVSPHEKRTIIELKSGKPFQANTYGISASHHAQATLYDMLLRSVYEDDIVQQSFILYSALEKNGLRSAPYLHNIRKELIYIRNAITMIHLHLALSDPEKDSLLDKVNIQSFAESEAFTRRDANIWFNAYNALQEVEKSYIKQYSKFIAQEQLIAKTGLVGHLNTPGLASLWLWNNAEKENQFAIITDLLITSIHPSKEESPLIILKNKYNKKKITNFRNGDTLVFFPETTNKISVLAHQVYKCTLILISNDEYHIRLRGRQFDISQYNADQLWILEHDVLDRSFKYQYENLFDFARANENYRMRMLGMKPSGILELNDQDTQFIPQATRSIIHKIISAEDYFLLWGPPGSGKTSIVIKYLITYLLKYTDEQILLLAYTNRAVDEICEVLEALAIPSGKSFIRIGSKYGVNPKYQKNLLDEQLRYVKNRKELKTHLNQTRIVTATIASIQGKKELLLLKSFDTVIIDEASQILEPNLIGLLSYFKRFVLIGDHLQLPAVSAIPDTLSEIKNVPLNELGIHHLNQSLFERLFYQCQTNQWNHSYEMLQIQGRMHEQIMQFPAKMFYGGKLNILSGNHDIRQKINLISQFPMFDQHTDESIFAKERLIYIPSTPDKKSSSIKTHYNEALLVVQTIASLKNLYEKNNLNWDESTLGVITPYRAQISTINNLLHDHGYDDIPVTVDTVERYQGGARDIIIISTCIHSSRQLNQISSMNTQGVDRKLNVALTRARNQIILIGDPIALDSAPLYKSLMASYYKLVMI